MPHVEMPWLEDANCKGADPDLFFPDKGDKAAADKAKAVCRVCMVRRECLDYALALNVKDGVWGGMSGRERRAHKRQQRQQAEGKEIA